MTAPSFKEAHVFPADGRYQASVSKDGKSYSIGIDADPVVALQKALRAPEFTASEPPVYVGTDLFA
ncbi:hypothetical protein IWQ55_000320 [Labrenzia sp. EL_208]|nr:hypothetical protein [Labrenzia sp. EL_132]MBG6227128.1 hypothetical protein [Labrenzia sp. EL_208]